MNAKNSFAQLEEENLQRFEESEAVDAVKAKLTANFDLIRSMSAMMEFFVSSYAKVLTEIIDPYNYEVNSETKSLTPEQETMTNENAERKNPKVW